MARLVPVTVDFYCLVAPFTATRSEPHSSDFSVYRMVFAIGDASGDVGAGRGVGGTAGAADGVLGVAESGLGRGLFDVVAGVRVELGAASSVQRRV